jgi:FKBP-type peptidyl-prolyl cis-trans isomerase (trigger factor)
MNVNVEKLPNSAVKITVTIENQKVKTEYEKVLNQAVENTEIQGFRKGTAPRTMVEEKIGVQKLYGDTLNILLQTYYPQALKEKSISPVSNPKVELKDFDIEKDLTFTATVATKPEVKLGDYKKALKKAFDTKYKETQKDLEKENKDKPKEEQVKEPHVHMTADDVIKVLIDESQVEIADVLLEEEVANSMQKLLNHLQPIGLTLDQYAKSQQKTEEDLKKEYEKLSEDNLKLEFVMSKLIEEEKIEVSDEEINQMINAVGDETTRQQIQEDQMQRFYVKSILQKNKLITKLIEIAEGEHRHEHK